MIDTSDESIVSLHCCHSSTAAFAEMRSFPGEAMNKSSKYYNFSAGCAANSFEWDIVGSVGEKSVTLLDLGDIDYYINGHLEKRYGTYARYYFAENAK